MLDFYKFYKELFSCFENYEFIYVFLVLVTFMCFIKLILELPSALLIRSSRL